MKRIFLIGPPGSGKTAAANKLSALTGWQFFDTDCLIEQQEKASVAAIFREQGEAYFRKLEADLLAALENNAGSWSEGGGPIIYATGGGLPVFGDNMQTMISLGDVIWLMADIEVLVKRLGQDEKRPLLSPSPAQRLSGALETETLAQRLSKLITPRLAVYAQAGYKIDTSALSPEQVAREIMSILDSGSLIR